MSTPIFYHRGRLVIQEKQREHPAPLWQEQERKSITITLKAYIEAKNGQ